MKYNKIRENERQINLKYKKSRRKMNIGLVKKEKNVVMFVLDVGQKRANWFQYLK